MKSNFFRQAGKDLKGCPRIVKEKDLTPYSLASFAEGIKCFIYRQSTTSNYHHTEVHAALTRVLCWLIQNCCVILISSPPPGDQYQDDISWSISYKWELSYIQKMLIQMNKDLRLLEINAGLHVCCLWNKRSSLLVRNVLKSVIYYNMKGLPLH